MLGDSIRVLFDKFSAAEKLIVAALLVALILCVTVILILLARILPSAPVPVVAVEPRLTTSRPSPLRVVQTADGKLYSISDQSTAPIVELSELAPSEHLAPKANHVDIAGNID